MKKRILFSLLVCMVSLALIISGCSDSKGKQEADSHIVNTTFYNYLKEGKFVELPAAQPQYPASGELFSENTSVFKLVPTNANTLQKKLPDVALSDFALYSLPVSTAKRTASTVSAAPLSAASISTAIPTLKKQDVIPASCVDLAGTDLRDCLDNLGVSSVPQSDHVSAHDLQSLAIEVGQSITGSIPDKTVQALTANVSKADRDAIAAKLTDFTNDDPAHANIDMAAFNPFNPAGYSLGTVVISDGSMSDINGDGVLDPHSTMITEIAKPVTYARSQSATLDFCVQKYGNNIEDRYVVKITTYVHLDSLKAQRQPLPVFTPTDAAPVAPSEFYDSIHNARIVNHALDANIIKSIYGSTAILPGSSTEYTLMFQIDPNQISTEYKDLLDKITAAGDTACQDVVELHINPRTAIISGMSSAGKATQKASGSLTVFYQVPVAFSTQLTAKISSALTGQAATISADSQPMFDYCMVDGTGRKVAIVDPVSGAVIPACEKFNQQALAKTVLMTKAGACKDDKGHWAYWPSRYRTPRFGRGIQWIYTECLLHDQVGDYKNIHWYQSAWKSGVQIAVRGAKIGLNTYLKIEIGAISLKNDDGTDKKKSLIYAKKLLPLLGTIVMKMNGMTIAGYKVDIPPVIGDFLASTSNYPTDSGSDSIFGNATIDYNLLMELTDGANSFFIDRMTDAVAQMLDVTIAGRQDISDRSHYGCFEFSY